MTTAGASAPIPTIPVISTGAELADIVAALRRAMRRAARAVDPENPLAVAQLELLSCVAERPGIRPGQLAGRLRLARNTVTTLVNGLHTRGLISRDATPGDGRAVALTLTDEGRSAVESWRDTNTAIVERALRALSEVRQQALNTVLPALRDLTQAIDAQAE
jgi:DNA-binding MarR family transcriptional regulator